MLGKGKESDRRLDSARLDWGTVWADRDLVLPDQAHWLTKSWHRHAQLTCLNMLDQCITHYSGTSAMDQVSIDCA